jgi:hypothetical protein
MSKLTTGILALAIGLAIPGLTTAADQPGITSIHRSPGDEKIGNAQGEFVAQIEELRAQFELHRSALALLEAKDDGSQKAAIEINLLRTILLGDRVNVILKVQPAATRLRRRFDQNLERTRIVVNSRMEELTNAQHLIDQLADKIVRTERNMGDSPSADRSAEQDGDGAETAILEANIAGWKAELAERVRQAEDRELDVKHYEEQIRVYEQEKRDLKLWNAKLEALVRTCQAQAEGMLDWFDDQTESDILDKIRQDREAIGSVMDLMSNLPVDSRGRMRRRTVDETQPLRVGADSPAKSIAPAPARRVLDEIEKARERLSKPR